MIKTGNIITNLPRFFAFCPPDVQKQLLIPFTFLRMSKIWPRIWKLIIFLPCGKRLSKYTFELHFDQQNYSLRNRSPTQCGEFGSWPATSRARDRHACPRVHVPRFVCFSFRSSLCYRNSCTIWRKGLINFWRIIACIHSNRALWCSPPRLALLCTKEALLSHS